MTKLPRSSYDRPVEGVARDLLGCVLVSRTGEVELSGRIVEVEAYGGSNDPGSHAFHGPTPRNAVMFGPPGHVYVYRIYHFHTCMNIVCGSQGTASAVLLRALEPLAGVEVMERNRGGRSLAELCNGPAKLCQALQISMEHNGLDLEGNTLWIEPGIAAHEIATSTRVGLSRGAELPLRFYVHGNPFVSRGRASG